MPPRDARGAIVDVDVRLTRTNYATPIWMTPMTRDNVLTTCGANCTCDLTLRFRIVEVLFKVLCSRVITFLQHRCPAREMTNQEHITIHWWYKFYDQRNCHYLAVNNLILNRLIWNWGERLKCFISTFETCIIFFFLIFLNQLTTFTNMPTPHQQPQSWQHSIDDWGFNQGAVWTFNHLVLCCHYFKGIRLEWGKIKSYSFSFCPT